MFHCRAVPQGRHNPSQYYHWSKEFSGACETWLSGAVFDSGLLSFQLRATTGEFVTVVIGFCAEGQAGASDFFMGGFKDESALELVNVLGCLFPSS